MGQGQSIIRLPAPNPNLPFFALTFRKPDTITFVLANAEIISIANKVCQESWKRGFEFIGKQNDDSYQFIFKGL
jgi:hypothetical protein